MAVEYNQDSIESLGEIAGVRLRPESLLGSNGVAGAEHTVIEIIGNSLDEKNSGYGDKLEVHWYGDGRVSVRDFGRGIPLDWNESQGEYNWKLIYNKLYAGGKYTDFSPLKELTTEEWKGITADNYKEELARLGINYLFSVGLNGMGSTATCATAEFLLVKSYHDGVMSSMRFKQGVAEWDELHKEATDEPNGTYVEWKPDPEVFSNAMIPGAWMRSICSDFSYSADITIDYYNETGEKETFAASNVRELIANKVKGGRSEDGSIDSSVVISRRGIFHDKERSRGVVSADNYDIGVMVYEVALGPTGSNAIPTRKFYANSVPVRGGTPADAIDSAVGEFFDARAREEYGVTLKAADYDGKVSMAVSILANLTNYRNQTKDEISDKYIYTGIYNAVKDMLFDAWSRGVKWVHTAVEEAIESYNARQMVAASRRVSKEVRSTLAKPISPVKFQPCRLYGKKSAADSVELWIVEGNSAGEQMKRSRNGGNQALYYLRGKGLNPLKADPGKALTSNKEISDIINVIGMGSAITGDQDVKKAKVGKVIIASDADRDGYHIRMLTFLIMWVYLPELLYSGKVYVAEPPLWRVDLRDGTRRYYITDEEYEADKPELERVGISHNQRFKGLGQMSAGDVADVLMSPENRTLYQVKLDRTDSSVDDVLQILFGASTEERKRGILAGFLGEEELDRIMSDIHARNELLRSMSIDSDIDVEQVVLG